MNVQVHWYDPASMDPGATYPRGCSMCKSVDAMTIVEDGDGRNVPCCPVCQIPHHKAGHLVRMVIRR